VSLEQVGDFATAERHDREAVRISPTFSNAYNNLAIIFYRSKRYKEAWIAVRACQANGGSPHPDFLKALAAAQPPPD